MLPGDQCFRIVYFDGGFGVLLPLPVPLPLAGHWLVPRPMRLTRIACPFEDEPDADEPTAEDDAELSLDFELAEPDLSTEPSTCTDSPICRCSGEASAPCGISRE